MGENIPVNLSSREPCMPAEPLPDDVVVRLRSDPTAALAAVLVVIGSYPNIVSWAARTFGDQSDTKPRTAGGGGQNVGNGGNGNDLPPRCGEATDRADQQMLALMRDNPGATVARLTELFGRSRSSTMLSLKRLEAAGLVNHRGHGSWAAVEDGPDLAAVEGDLDLTAEGSPLPPKTADWVAPLSGKHIARHTAGGRVREQATTIACPL